LQRGLLFAPEGALLRNFGRLIPENSAIQITAV
jgi:hypothetical protein